MTRMPPGDYDDFGDAVWTPNVHGNNGAAHTVSDNARPDDVVRQLREVVSEVTNGRIPVPQRRGPGFY